MVSCISQQPGLGTRRLAREAGEVGRGQQDQHHLFWVSVRTPARTFGETLVDALLTATCPSGLPGCCDPLLVVCDLRQQDRLSLAPGGKVGPPPAGLRQSSGEFVLGCVHSRVSSLTLPSASRRLLLLHPFTFRSGLKPNIPGASVGRATSRTRTGRTRERCRGRFYEGIW